MILSINANNLNYDIVIERNSLSKASEYLNLDRKVLVVTDNGVPSIYAETILSQCKDGYVFTFKNGEENKCFETYKSILSFLIDKSCFANFCKEGKASTICLNFMLFLLLSSHRINPIIYMIC